MLTLIIYDRDNGMEGLFIANLFEVSQCQIRHNLDVDPFIRIGFVLDQDTDQHWFSRCRGGVRREADAAGVEDGGPAQAGRAHARREVVVVGARVTGAARADGQRGAKRQPAGRDSKRGG